MFDQDLDQRNKNHCNYLIGLGYLGLNNDHIENAFMHFNLVLQHDINYPGAAIHLKMALRQTPVE